MSELQLQAKPKKLPDGSIIIVIEMYGVIDGSTAKQLEENLLNFLNRSIKNIVLMWTGITHINSTGMGLLVNLADRFRAVNGDVRLASVPPKVVALFEMLGIIPVFQLYPGEREALSSFLAPKSKSSATQAKNPGATGKNVTNPPLAPQTLLESESGRIKKAKIDPAIQNKLNETQIDEKAQQDMMLGEVVKPVVIESLAEPRPARQEVSEIKVEPKVLKQDVVSAPEIRTEPKTPEHEMSISLAGGNFLEKVSEIKDTIVQEQNRRNQLIQKSILQLMEAKFGKVPQEIQHQIYGMQTLESLEKMLNMCATTDSLVELTKEVFHPSDKREKGRNAITLEIKIYY